MDGLMLAGLVGIVVGLGGVITARARTVKLELLASPPPSRPWSPLMVVSLIALGLGVLTFGAFVLGGLFTEPSVGS